jgi:hypothetical protein
MKEKLDIGCGRDKDPEFFGIDITDWPGVDLAWDMEKFPWPIEDNSFSYIKAIHVVEHINDQVVFFVKFIVLQKRMQLSTWRRRIIHLVTRGLIQRMLDTCLCFLQIK